MKLQMKGTHRLLLCCLMLTTSTCAFAARRHHKTPSYRYTQLNHYEAIGALGLANLRASNGNIGVTSSETDKLVQTNSNNWNTFDAQIGAGYVYYFEQRRHPPKTVQWFPAVEPQINLYYLKTNGNAGIKGDVWRFGSSSFNQLTYKIPVRSTRLMFDVALTVVKKLQSSLYVKAGIGNAWNRISYSDADNGTSGADCVNQVLNLNSSTRSHFAWELGVGLLHDINNHVGLSLEYLYTSFGTVKTSASGSSGTITTPIITPATFSMRAQTVAFGLHFGI